MNFDQLSKFPHTIGRERAWEDVAPRGGGWYGIEPFLCLRHRVSVTVSLWWGLGQKKQKWFLACLIALIFINLVRPVLVQVRVKALEGRGTWLAMFGMFIWFSWSSSSAASFTSSVLVPISIPAVYYYHIGTSSFTFSNQGHCKQSIGKAYIPHLVQQVQWLW